MKKSLLSKALSTLLALSLVTASVCAALIDAPSATNQKAATTLQIENGMIVNIKAGTKAYYIIDAFADDVCSVKDHDGKAVKSNAIVASGYTLVNSTTSETLKIIVNGDVNGDGIVNGVDILRAKKHIGGNSVQSRYEEAIDFNRDGKYTTADVDMMVSSVLEGPYEMPDTDDLPLEELEPADIGSNFWGNIRGVGSNYNIALSGDTALIRYPNTGYR